MYTFKEKLTIGFYSILFEIKFFFNHNKIFLFLVDWIWCFPQTFIGFILSWTIWRKSYRKKDFEELALYYNANILVKDEGGKVFDLISGTSLGRYILVKDYHNERVVRHEIGHLIQSRILGWFYLLVVGLPSVINNLRARKNEIVWLSYYNRYPEKWADKLGKALDF